MDNIDNVIYELLKANVDTKTNIKVKLKPKHNKNVWENCAVIIAEKNDENLKPYLVELLDKIYDKFGKNID